MNPLFKMYFKETNVIRNLDAVVLSLKSLIRNIWKDWYELSTQIIFWNRRTTNLFDCLPLFFFYFTILFLIILLPITNYVMMEVWKIKRTNNLFQGHNLSVILFELMTFHSRNQWTVSFGFPEPRTATPFDILCKGVYHDPTGLGHVTNMLFIVISHFGIEEGTGAEC